MAPEPPLDFNPSGGSVVERRAHIKEDETSYAVAKTMSARGWDRDTAVTIAVIWGHALSEKSGPE